MSRLRKTLKPCWKNFVCVKSKAAVVILAINTIVSIVYGLQIALAMFLPLFIDKIHPSNSLVLAPIINGSYTILAFILLFYPLGGCLADVYCGRYRVISISLVLFWSGIALACIGFTAAIAQYKNLYFFLPITILVALLYIVGFSGFQSNVVQFGLDQLQEASSEELSIFLHWFVWTDALGQWCVRSLVAIGVCQKVSQVVGLSFSPQVVLVIFTALVCLSYNKKQAWFYIEPAVFNPYKTVFRVLKFVKKHKYPLQRSAFTYTGDEQPSRIDYAKSKYGGPFTTEEVEDVKTFLRILGLLFCIGPIFIADVDNNYLFALFGIHLGNNHTALTCTRGWILLEAGTLSPLITTTFLPIYMYFFIALTLYRRKLFTMLHRLGIGIAISAVGRISLLLIDAIGHHISGIEQCVFTERVDPPTPTLNLPTSLLLIPIVLNSIGPPLVSITVFEFISAQSPHTMKGLLVGVFYAIKGLFLLLGTTTLLPFILGYRHTNGSSVSCGTGYYLLTAIIAVIGLVLYVLAARRYKYRQREEQPYNQMHVEAYYERSVAQELNDTNEQNSDNYP